MQVLQKHCQLSGQLHLEHLPTRECAQNSKLVYHYAEKVIMLS